MPATNSYRILIAEDVDPVAAQMFKICGMEVTQNRSLTTQGIIDIIEDYNVLIVRSRKIKDKEIFKNAKNLLIIGRAGTGYDNIDLEAATNKGIMVMNAPDGNAPSTAELTMGHITGLARGMSVASGKVLNGIWDRDTPKQHHTLMNKTLGIIGCGRIGSRVAMMARAAGMNVIVYDPYIPDINITSLGATRATLDNLFKASDFITLHPTLNSDTRNIINYENLKKCKKGVYIINCARGAMVVPEDLSRAIMKGRVNSAALDVLPVEPSNDNPDLWKDNPLLAFGDGKVNFTAHQGGTTQESSFWVAQQIAEQVIDYLAIEKIANAVNYPFLEREQIMSKGIRTAYSYPDPNTYIQGYKNPYPNILISRDKNSYQKSEVGAYGLG
ncbi:MAG: hydroxyacid dehydrogenase [Alphaproteobacteria bacterium]|nr:hydroxyacid dehydrogenase [Alphaproteobacteria bacterium]